MLELVTIPCLSDNYAFLLHDAATNTTALVDAPEAAPILTALSERGWTLDHALITHHHWDHVDGLAEILDVHGAEVWGAAADAQRLPPLNHALAEGDRVTIGAETGHVLDVSGHTQGHIAYIFEGYAFTADSLMALGCGRLFEGTAAEMHASLAKLAALPPETLICSGHEYTQANANFALTIDPGNSALISRAEEIKRKRAAGQPTVPSKLDEELATNPFLRTDDAAIRARLDLAGAPAEAVFAEIRARKDRF